MSLARARELLAAWEAGTARECDLAELRRLLPAVLNAAERCDQIADAAHEVLYVAPKGPAIAARIIELSRLVPRRS